MSEWFFTSILLVCLLAGRSLAQGQAPAAASGPATQAEGAAVSTIATEHTWVSPYWGYNTPKIVYDGSTYYTVGIRGADPEHSEGIIYKYSDGQWTQTALLPGIYQPPTLLLDSQRRLIVLYTRNLKPVVILRARRPGDASDFEALPSPPDMPNAYYIGVAIDGEVIHLAYVRAYLQVKGGQQDYSMLLTRLDLRTMTWSPSALMQAGQVTAKPKSAWTYPILQPTAEGLHVIASNSPDGGEGNTYNRVEYLFYPPGSDSPSIRQTVAEGTIGHVTYGYAMTVGPDGAIHVVHLWNSPGYGPPLPPDSPEGGVYHSWRMAGQDQWTHAKLDLDNPRLFNSGQAVFVIGMKGGALQVQPWQPRTQEWAPPRVLCPTVPVGHAFMDVLRASSGSVMGRGMALVADGRLEADASGKRPNLAWALLEAQAASP